ncbi:MAG: T9SS type A sorting domain-containing protein, partial [Pedobacter sp.]
DNNLYIFSARNHVFKVDIETKVATHLGSVTGLPTNFTANGTAVTLENKVMITSATDNSAIYQLDIKDLVATPITTGVKPWKTSDLANSNLFRSGKYDFGVPDFLAAEKLAAGNGVVDIYPNPVTNKQFALQFNKLEPGTYTVQILDGNGKQLSQEVVAVSGKGQTERIKLPALITTGLYLVKIVDHNKKAVYTDKLLVQ